MQRTAERNASVCGWPSSTLTIGALRSAGKRTSRIASSPASRPCRACNARKTRSAEVRHTTSTAEASRGELVGGCEHVGDHGAHGDERHRRGLRRAAQDVTPGEHLEAALLARRVALGERGQRLVDRARAEAEVGGCAVAVPEAGERGEQRPFEILAEGRLPGDATRLLEPDRGRDDRLMRTALGRERDAGWRADEDRLPAGVDAERPRLQRAVDERVVERPDRQQRQSGARPRRAELAEQADEVALRDAELDVPAVRGLAPAHERVGVVGEPVDAIAHVPDAGAVDPAAQARGRRDVGRDGDDALRDLGRSAREVGEEATEGLLGRGAGSHARDRRRAAPRGARPAAAAGAGAARRRAGRARPRPCLRGTPPTDRPRRRPARRRAAPTARSS